MTRHPKLAFSAFLSVLLLATPLFCAAAEGGTSEQPVDQIFKWGHFVIIAILAIWVFGKLLPPAFAKKADLIGDAIAKATAAKEEADHRLREAAVKLTTLEQEIASFRAQAQKEAATEIERLRSATKGEIQKIGVAVSAEIEAAERAARAELKALAAKLAVDRAESLVAQQMTPEIQNSLISNFVQNLQGRPN